MTGSQSSVRSTLSIAFRISRFLASYPAELASRCTNNRSNSDSAASAARIFRASGDPDRYLCSDIELSGMADPTASVAPHSDSKLRRCVASGRSEVPSQRRMKRIVRGITKWRRVQAAHVVSHHRAVAGSRTTSKYQAPAGLPFRRAKSVPRGSIGSKVPWLLRTAPSFLSRSICQRALVAGGDTGNEWRQSVGA